MSLKFKPPGTYFAENGVAVIDPFMEALGPSLSQKSLAVMETWKQEKQKLLYPWQDEFYPALAWLYSPDNKLRGEGRTTMLAMVYIDLALNNPGYWIRPMDHAEVFGGSPYNLRDMIMSYIKDLLCKSGIIHPFEFKKLEFRFLGY